MRYVALYILFLIGYSIGYTIVVGGVSTIFFLLIASSTHFENTVLAGVVGGVIISVLYGIAVFFVLERLGQGELMSKTGKIFWRLTLLSSLLLPVVFWLLS